VLKTPALTESGAAKDRYHFTYATDEWEKMTTAGLDQDLFYHLVVDGIPQPSSFSAGAPVTVSRLTPGPHIFRLEGVSSNCRAEPEQQTVTVVAASTVPIDFVVTCVAGPAVVKVTVTTEGEDRDLSGYTLGVSGRTMKVKASDVAFFHSVFAGSRSVSLRGVASNCTPDATDIVVDVVAGGMVRDTLDLAFRISCVQTWEVAFTRYVQGPDPFGLRVGRLDGSVVELVTTATAKPAWSPDGQAIAYSCAGVCILRLDGTAVTTLPIGQSTGGLRSKSPCTAPRAF